MKSQIYLWVAMTGLLIITLAYHGISEREVKDSAAQITEINYSVTEIRREIAALKADVMNAQNGLDIHAEALENVEREISALNADFSDFSSDTITYTPVEEIALKTYTDADVDAIARVHYYEDRFLPFEEQDLLTWCILQRADDGIGCEAGSDTAIIDTITYPRSWDSYSESNPIVPEVRERVVQCVEAWARGEQAPTHPEYAPTLPYYGYYGTGAHNYFHG